jgi:3-hydroxybutyryl-CoA dehydratase
VRLGEGASLPDYAVTVEASTLRAVAELLRDPNPIHLDAHVVRQLGLGDRVVSQGPLNIGIVWQMLDSRLAGAGRVSRLDVRFTSNAFAGEQLVAGGEVTGGDDAEGTATCEVWLRAASGRDVLRGRAIVQLGPTEERS